MKVFKFGGASVKDADAVRNVTDILDQYRDEAYVVVISAMGKTTNALENILNQYMEGNEACWEELTALKAFHMDIAKALFDDEQHPVFDELENLFFDLEFYFEKEPNHSYDYLYDQVISYGEVLSTRIVSAYLNHAGLKNKWIDARNFVITDHTHREAKVDWAHTSRLIDRKLRAYLSSMPVITQGFIGSTENKVTTTLGREGSDYTAAIFAYSLDAEGVVIWKDVPGVLNADPKQFEDTVKFDRLSYEEAIEMTYYGSKVLHPKTIKPLQNKGIPLYVRSFLDWKNEGTIITNVAEDEAPLKAPVIILKQNQLLLKLHTKDYSFIEEENLSKIFGEMAKNGIQMNLMNTSAISFSVCLDHDGHKVEAMKTALEPDFDVEEVRDLELLTIRHYQESIVKKFIQDKTVLMENSNGETVQFVLKSENKNF